MAKNETHGENKKACFIAMPISTPEQWKPHYSNDSEHFKHVLECLFIPAIEKAGMKPIPPISKGSDVIHADIIRQLESADLVMVDMSTLNANVFFEFGIRVSLDKPICLIIDDKTAKVPFDAGLINHHSYSSALNAWELNRQIDILAEHIREAATPKPGALSLWKSFSLTARATIVDPNSVTTDQRIEHLSEQIEVLTRKVMPTNAADLLDTPSFNLYIVYSHDQTLVAFYDFLKSQIPGVKITPRFPTASQPRGETGITVTAFTTVQKLGELLREFNILFPDFVASISLKTS